MRLKPNVKIGVVIVLFSLLSTFVIVAGVYLWQKSVSTSDIASSLGTDVYVFRPDEKVSIESAQGVTINPNSLINSKDFDNLYYQSFFSNLPIILSLICLMIIVVTIILWLILRNIYRNQTLAIIDELAHIKKLDERNVGKNPISDSLNQLRDAFSETLEDYKRLSSYLTHDQKNTIAILRSNLEQKETNHEEIALLDYLTDSVDDILTLTSSQDEANEKVDVALVCAEVCDAYRKIYSKIEFEFEEDQDMIIIGKNRWIYRAVSNLLGNAIKYGKNEPILLSIRQKKNSVIIKVKDHGYGMREEDQMKVFDHKYRVKGLKQDGHGIGLSVVRHVCDLCQGYIFIDSAKNEGSTFYLSLPLA